MHWRRIVVTGRRRRAQAFVELALSMPVILVLLLGTYDFGRAYIIGVAVQQGTREAARLGAGSALDSAISDDVIRQRLIDAAAPTMQGVTGAQCASACTDSQGLVWTVTISKTPAGTPTVIAVSASTPMPLATGFLTSLVGISNIPITGSSQMPLL